MDRCILHRRKYQLNSFVKNIWNYFGIKMLIVLAFFVIGVILGFVITSEIVSDLTSDNIVNTALISFLARESNCFSLFLSYLITHLLIICYAIFFNRNIFLHIINICIIFMLGYIFACDFLILINLFNFITIILAIIIMPVFTLLIMLVYSLIVAIIWRRNSDIKRFGRFCPEFDHRRLLIILIIVLILLLFVYCLILNLITLFFVLV